MCGCVGPCEVVLPRTACPCNYVRMIVDSSHFRWNMFNQEKKPEKLAPQAEEKRDGEKDEEEGEVEVFAQPPDDKAAPRGWLCDLINIFGEEGGFRSLHRRICGGTEALTVMVVAAQIRLAAGWVWVCTCI